MNKILLLSVCIAGVSLAVIFILTYYNTQYNGNLTPSEEPSYQDNSYKVVLIHVENNTLVANPSTLTLDSKAHSIVWRNLSEYPVRITIPNNIDFRVPLPDYLNTVIEPNGFTVLTWFDEGKYSVNIHTIENKGIKPISVFENNHFIIFEPNE